MQPVDLFPLIRPLLKTEDFQTLMLEFVSGLAFAFQYDRVSIGFVDKNTIQIAAVSGFSELPSAAMLPELLAAMQESILQDVAIVFPQPHAEFPHIVLAHAKLAQISALTRAITVPFGHDARIVGAITFERQRVVADDAEQLEVLAALAQQASPLLELKWRLSLPPLKRARQWCRRQIDALDERATRWRYGAIAAALVLVAGIIVLPVTNEVAGQARLEAYTQRIITAPIDGFLKTVRVRPGDIVKARQSLAELSDDSLRSEQRRLVAEAAQEENSVAEAMAKYDRAQVVVHRAKLDSLLAQKELIEERLGRIQMIAPFDGVVIKGDLTQMMGAPVKRGDVLLTLAEGTGFRVIVDVPERDIADIEVGQAGSLMLTAMPEQKLRIHIVRIMPVANVSAENQNGFEVEAVLDQPAPALVPGLKGAAKIATGQKAFGWKWLVRGWQRLYFLVWSRGG
ncbi:MAG: efflux RND transporter periplasmic adaptor subunit [Janthinobacterium lividum]